LTRDVLRIDAIPSTSLDSVREWQQSMDIKFYENKINLNWKPILKSILEVRLTDHPVHA
jgi:nucleosome binding factor SPN SPT16 subunit